MDKAVFLSHLADRGIALGEERSDRLSCTVGDFKFWLYINSQEQITKFYKVNLKTGRASYPNLENLTKFIK